MSDQEPDLSAELQEFRDKIWGSRTVVPDTYVQLLHGLGLRPGVPFAHVRDQTKGEYQTCWLDGQLLRSLVYRGEEKNASADAVDLPLRTLESVKSAYAFDYDDHVEKHTRFRRSVTLCFQNEEPIDLETWSPTHETDAGKFVDALIAALADNQRAD